MHNGSASPQRLGLTFRKTGKPNPGRGRQRVERQRAEEPSEGTGRAGLKRAVKTGREMEHWTKQD